MEEKAHPWILGKPKTTLTRMGSLSASIAIYMNIWQKTVRNQGRNKTLESATNVNKYDTLLKTVNQDKR